MKRGRGRPKVPEGTRRLWVQGKRRVMVVKVGERWVYEHRHVASEVLGRPVDEGEEVHHLNGDSTDNTPTNLTVMTKTEHRVLHNAQGRWTRRFDACVYCGRADRRHSGHGVCCVCATRLRRGQPIS